MNQRITKREKLEMTRIADKYGITYKEVEQIIRSQYDCIRSVITNLDLPRDLTEEEFNKTVKNFNIPSIGKMYASYAVYKRINKL